MPYCYTHQQWDNNKTGNLMRIIKKSNKLQPKTRIISIFHTQRYLYNTHIYTMSRREEKKNNITKYVCDISSKMTMWLIYP